MYTKYGPRLGAGPVMAFFNCYGTPNLLVECIYLAYFAYILYMFWYILYVYEKP